MWQKQGDFNKEHFYTEECNRLCKYINTGPGRIKEIKLMAYTNGQSGIMIKFDNAQSAIDYEDFLSPLNSYDRQAVFQKDNIVMIKDRSPIYLASFLLGLNRITNYPEVVEIESLIMEDLRIDLTKDMTLEEKDEPVLHATMGQLVEGVLRSLAIKDELIFGAKISPLFFKSVPKNKDIEDIADIATLSPR